MAANMRNITQQNTTMHELLRNAWGQGGYLAPPYSSQGNAFHDSLQENYYQGENKILSQMVAYQQYARKKIPEEREVGIDTSTNYAIDQLHEIPFNFPPNYDPKTYLEG